MNTNRIFSTTKTGCSRKIALSVVITCLTTSTWAGVVTSNADSGPGTLREEIQFANADLSPTVITFSPHIAGSTIHLLSRLPALTDSWDKIKGSHGVVIDGSAVSDSPAARAVGIRVRAKGIIIEKLIIKNFANNGISVAPVSGTSGTIIDHVILRKNKLMSNLDGISISGGQGPNNKIGVLVEKNRLIKNQDDGIFVDGSSGKAGDGHNHVSVKIFKNAISGSLGSASGGTTSGDGIRVLGARGVGAYNHVNAMIKYNNSTDNVDDGIIVAGAGGNAASHNIVKTKIVGNTVQNNGEPTSTLGNGIVVRAGSRGGAVNYGNNNTLSFLVHRNKVKNNRDIGILLTGGAGTKSDFPVTKNTLTGSAKWNFVYGSGQDGLKLTGGSGTENTLTDLNLERNWSINNAGHGIRVTNSTFNSTLSNIRIVHNYSKDNILNGIYVNGGNSDLTRIHISELNHNVVLSNNANGIEIDSRETNDTFTQTILTIDKLVHNMVKQNQGNGILIRNSNAKLAGSGVYVTEIHKNKINTNGQNGLFINVDHVGVSQVTSNFASKNGETGIRVSSDNGDNVLVKNNRAFHNIGNGIDCRDHIPDGGGNIAEGNAGCNTPGCFTI